MKTLITIFALGAVTLFGINAIKQSEASAHIKKAKTVEQQLADYVSPALLEQMNQEDVVVRFHVDGEKQIARLDVKGATPTLTTQLANELKGKSLIGKEVDTESTYEARFRVKTT